MKLPSARENLSQLPAIPIRGASSPLRRVPRRDSLNHITGEFQLPRSSDFRREAGRAPGLIESAAMRTRKPAVFALVAVLALAFAPLALADPGFGPPLDGSEEGEVIKWLYWFVFAICAIVFVLVETILILFVIRFRRRRSGAPDAEGPQIHGNTRVEIIWTVIPAVILAGIAAVVLARSPSVEADVGGGQGDELVITVEAHQFYWEYVYPDGQISLDTLILPVDRPVKLELVSYDVNHSWWVPELTGKRDAIPGRTNDLSFTPTREGTFEGQCAELCGILHAIMPTTVEVVSEAEYADRLTLLTDQDQPGATQLALGRESWERACAKCHGLSGEGDIGPPIAKNGTLVDEQDLTELLTQGRDQPDVEGYMPPVGSGWPEFQVQALIAYIRSNERLAEPQQPEQESER
jgi:cytochrome c oxidase subunit II